MTPELTAEQREFIDEIAVGWPAEEKWFFEQEVRLLNKYRIRRHMLENPWRLFWYELLFPFFHWRLLLERHNRWMARQMGRLFMPFLASFDEGVAHVNEVQEAARKIREAM